MYIFFLPYNFFNIGYSLKMSDGDSLMCCHGSQLLPAATALVKLRRTFSLWCRLKLQKVLLSVHVHVLHCEEKRVKTSEAGILGGNLQVTFTATDSQWPLWLVVVVVLCFASLHIPRKCATSPQHLSNLLFFKVKAPHDALLWAHFGDNSSV